MHMRMVALREYCASFPNGVDSHNSNTSRLFSRWNSHVDFFKKCAPLMHRMEPYDLDSLFCFVLFLPQESPRPGIKLMPEQ